VGFKWGILRSTIIRKKPNKSWYFSGLVGFIVVFLDSRIYCNWQIQYVCQINWQYFRQIQLNIPLEPKWQ